MVDSSNEWIWSVTLDPQMEEGPFQVNVTQPWTNNTMETITLTYVLFGDVWLCSGQSNMQFSLGNMFNASIKTENGYKYSKVRVFTTAPSQSSTPQEELMGISLNWSLPSNSTLNRTLFDYE